MKFTRVGQYYGVDLFRAQTTCGQYSIVHDNGIFSATYKLNQSAEKVWLVDEAKSWFEAETACETYDKMLRQ